MRIRPLHPLSAPRALLAVALLASSFVVFPRGSSATADETVRLVLEAPLVAPAQGAATFRFNVDCLPLRSMSGEASFGDGVVEIAVPANQTTGRGEIVVPRNGECAVNWTEQDGWEPATAADNAKAVLVGTGATVSIPVAKLGRINIVKSLTDTWTAASASFAYDISCSPSAPYAEATATNKGSVTIDAGVGAWPRAVQSQALRVGSACRVTEGSRTEYSVTPATVDVTVPASGIAAEAAFSGSRTSGRFRITTTVTGTAAPWQTAAPTFTGKANCTIGTGNNFISVLSNVDVTYSASAPSDWIGPVPTGAVCYVTQQQGSNSSIQMPSGPRSDAVTIVAGDNSIGLRNEWSSASIRIQKSMLGSAAFFPKTASYVVECWETTVGVGVPFVASASGATLLSFTVPDTKTSPRIAVPKGATCRVAETVTVGSSAPALLLTNVRGTDTAAFISTESDGKMAIAANRQGPAAIDDPTTFKFALDCTSEAGQVTASAFDLIADQEVGKVDIFAGESCVISGNRGAAGNHDLFDVTGEATSVADADLGLNLIFGRRTGSLVVGARSIGRAGAFAVSVSCSGFDLGGSGPGGARTVTLQTAAIAGETASFRASQTITGLPLGVQCTATSEETSNFEQVAVHSSRNGSTDNLVEDNVAAIEDDSAFVESISRTIQGRVVATIDVDNFSTLDTQTVFNLSLNCVDPDAPGSVVPGFPKNLRGTSATPVVFEPVTAGLKCSVQPGTLPSLYSFVGSGSSDTPVGAMDFSVAETGSTQVNWMAHRATGLLTVTNDIQPRLPSTDLTQVFNYTVNCDPDDPASQPETFGLKAGETARFAVPIGAYCKVEQTTLSAAFKTHVYYAPGVAACTSHMGSNGLLVDFLNVPAGSPLIAMNSTAAKTGALGTPISAIESGGSVTWTYRVYLPTGSLVGLTGVSVIDDSCSPVVLVTKENSDNDDVLEPVETWVYRCVKTLSSDATGRASASGTTDAATKVSASANAPVTVTAAVTTTSVTTTALTTTSVPVTTEAPTTTSAPSTTSAPLATSVPTTTAPTTVAPTTTDAPATTAGPATTLAPTTSAPTTSAPVTTSAPETTSVPATTAVSVTTAVPTTVATVTTASPVTTSTTVTTAGSFATFVPTSTTLSLIAAVQVPTPTFAPTSTPKAATIAVSSVVVEALVAGPATPNVITSTTTSTTTTTRNPFLVPEVLGATVNNVADVPQDVLALRPVNARPISGAQVATAINTEGSQPIAYTGSDFRVLRIGLSLLLIGLAMVVLTRKRPEW